MFTKSHLSSLGQKSNHNPTIRVSGQELVAAGEAPFKARGRGLRGEKQKAELLRQMNLCERIVTFQYLEGRGVNRGFK